ncbi:MAG: hypothetical protein WCP85_22725 [Mariniphaga sp.]
MRLGAGGWFLADRAGGKLRLVAGNLPLADRARMVNGFPKNGSGNDYKQNLFSITLIVLAVALRRSVDLIF